VDSGTGDVVGVEGHCCAGGISSTALYGRWSRSIVERTKLIHDIGAWVLFGVCRQLVAWRKLCICNDRAMSVNLSAMQLKGLDCRQMVAQGLAQIGIKPNTPRLEIAESALIDDLEKSATLVHSLGDMGVRVAIDDLGTGFSSLQYLKPAHQRLENQMVVCA
jgi:EAL domain-containing protein (putative c-di-GMP-specific phosphodiesterase class I)